MAEKEYLFATGRLVQGDVFEPQTKNMNGGPLTNLRGEPKIQYFIAVACPKSDPKTVATYQRIQEIAVAGFPGGETQLPNFAWKVLDGDQHPNNTKIGFPGCYVFRLATGFQPKAYTQGGASQIVDPAQIKRGYFIRAAFTCAPNGNQKKPGVYLNTELVELIGYGEEINNGPDAAALLGAAGVAVLPAGASATPVAGGAPIQPPAQTSSAGMPPAQTSSAQAPAAPPVPPAPIAPAPDFLTPPVLTEKAAGMSYQQFIDAGWTDEMLKQNGYMV
jgi:hypothetical protein